MEKGQHMRKDRVILEIKTSRTTEETAESMVQFLASLTGLRVGRLGAFFKIGIPISLEIGVIHQGIHFYLSCPPEYQAFMESQLVSQYPHASIIKTTDFLPNVLSEGGSVAMGQLKLFHTFIYPLRSLVDFKEVDPMSSLLGVLSKAQPTDRVAIQYLLLPVSSAWHGQGEKIASTKTTDAAGVEHANPYAHVIKEKIKYHGFKVAIRIAVASESRERSVHFLGEIANSYASFNNPSGNSLVLKKPYLWQKDRLKSAMLGRHRRFIPGSQILNVEEIAAMYHLPNEKLSKIQNISWHKSILSEPPENLPVAEGLTDEQKSEINFFAQTEFKNKPTNFGIKTVDRRKHVYVIGKTGTGKSTFIANMAINDMRNRRGFCVIDPHGDLCETLLNYVPSYRVNDVIYLDPSDTEFTFALNPLEVQNPGQRELVVSGIVSIFNKLYANSWGPRLEYILRNTILSVIDLPDATLLMVPEMLSNENFRKRAVSHLTDPVLISFWENEFANYTDKLRAEAISPIQNKVGQFVSSPTIRKIIQHPKSSIDLERIMNEGKILLLNLSQGKLGEDNAALLGAMTITKLQLAAMNRVTIREDERRDFYLYVDEFQNFATGSFIKILSEARKYRLDLILANQYIGQIPEDVRLAIFGNTGTMLSFLVGAGDSPYLAREFGERFKEEDLLSLGNYQAIIKMAIDGLTQSPFLCYTLPLPKSVTQNREKVIRMSRERYMKKIS
jgi:hypothetical protein